MRGLAVADGGSFLPDFASDNRLIHRHKGAGFVLFMVLLFYTKRKEIPKIGLCHYYFLPQKNPNKNNKKN